VIPEVWMALGGATGALARALPDKGITWGDARQVVAQMFFAGCGAGLANLVGSLGSDFLAPGLAGIIKSALAHPFLAFCVGVGSGHLGVHQWWLFRQRRRDGNGDRTPPMGTPRP